MLVIVFVKVIFSGIQEHHKPCNTKQYQVIHLLNNSCTKTRLYLRVIVTNVDNNSIECHHNKVQFSSDFIIEVIACPRPAAPPRTTSTATSAASTRRVDPGLDH